MDRKRCLCAWLLAGLCLPALADEDHLTAYRLRQQADIQPLEQILERLGLDPASRVLEVEAEFEDGRNLYEIKYLTPDGRVHEVKVDAKSGEPLEQEPN